MHLQTYRILFLLLFFTVFASEAQEALLRDYDEFAEVPDENIYLQVNKHLFMPGEFIGISAYVFNRYELTPATLTTNIYCDIVDNTGVPIKQKLLLASEGKTDNNFKIDSLMPPGDYTVRAYTSFMRNFDYQGSQEVGITVLESSGTIEPVTEYQAADLDVGILPEGGHMVAGVLNTLGIIVRSPDGRGVKGVQGVIKNRDNVIGRFKTEELGLAKAVIRPDASDELTAEILYQGATVQLDMPRLRNRGIFMTVNSGGDNGIISIETNNRTLKEIRGKQYHLLIHDGVNIISQPVMWDSPKKFISIDYNQLSPGTNILTLIDEDMRPILERMIFNFEKIERLRPKKSSAKVVIDSVEVRIALKNLSADSTIRTFFSASILPVESISYRPEHNILSAVLLKPYLRGNAMDGAYLLGDTDRKKKYLTDLLMLTQGWSTYDWDELGKFTLEEAYYPFEQGIKTIGKLNDSRIKCMLRYPMTLHNSEIINVEQGREFVQVYFPINEPLTVSGFKSNGKAQQPSVYFRFFPSVFPEFKFSNLRLPKLFTGIESSSIPANPFRSTDGQLEEVYIQAESEKLKREEIQGKSFGQVYFFSDSERELYNSIDQMLGMLPGFNVQLIRGRLSVTQFGGGNDGATPTLVIDEVRYPDFEILNGISPLNIDYIEVLRNSVLYSSGGGDINVKVIKVVTKKATTKENSRKDTRDYVFPLSFAEHREFYVPKYKDYTSDFFKEYGAIDWQGQRRLNKEGEIRFTVPDAFQQQMVIHLEGADSSGRLCSETIVVNVER